MKFRLSAMALSFAAMAMTAPVAMGNANNRVGQYDFSYIYSGSSRITPVQVFDDGQKTFFQFRAGEAIPAIFGMRGGEVILLTPSFEGPYVTVPEVLAQYRLQQGRAQAHVMHSASERPGGSPVTAISPQGMSAPYTGVETLSPGTRLVASATPTITQAAYSPDALQANSYASPVRGDTIEWQAGRVESIEHAIMFVEGRGSLGPIGRRTTAALAKGAGRNDRFVVIGRDDTSSADGLGMGRAQAIKKVLMDSGVAEDRISVRVGERGKEVNDLWPSTVLVETVTATQIARPSSVEAGLPHTRNPAVRSNIEALLRAGVLTRDQAEALLRDSSPAQAAAPSNGAEVPAGGFTLLMKDKTIAGTMRRWAQATGYEVVWDAPANMDAPIAGETVLRASSLREALDRIVSGLRDKGYALEATIYSNRVIRFSSSATANAGGATEQAPVVQPVQPKEMQRPTMEPSKPQRSTQPSVVATKTWTLGPSDQHLQGALERWAQQSEWKLVWNASDRVAINGSAEVARPSFVGAADYVIAQAMNAGYRMKAVAYANNTLVVTNE